MRWVVLNRSEGSSWFADDEWEQTTLLKAAARFGRKSDAALCAATMSATFGARLMVVDFRRASRW